MGAVMPEALAAWEAMAGDVPGLGLLAVTSPDLLHRGWSADGERSTVARMLGALPAGARLVTMLDGSPAALSWLGGVRGQRVVPLGIDRFGQTGDLPDLYHEYGLDADAVVSAMARALLG
jgi:pyruvate dehydrogenase E1 component